MGVMGLYELLSVLCSPDTNAAQHLEMNQVWRFGEWEGGMSMERNEHGEGGRGRDIKERKEGGGGFREGGNEFLRTVGCVCMPIRVYINLYSLTSLVPRPPPSFPSLVVRKSGRGPGTFPHVSDVTDRANYVNVGDM